MKTSFIITSDRLAHGDTMQATVLDVEYDDPNLNVKKALGDALTVWLETNRMAATPDAVSWERMREVPNSICHQFGVHIKDHEIDGTIVHSMGSVPLAERIVAATYTSKWEGGTNVTSECKVNLETGELTDIGRVDVDPDGSLESETVEIDGVEYPVLPCDELGNQVFNPAAPVYWYS